MTGPYDEHKQRRVESEQAAIKWRTVDDAFRERGQRIAVGSVSGSAWVAKIERLGKR